MTYVHRSGWLAVFKFEIEDISRTEQRVVGAELTSIMSPSSSELDEEEELDPPPPPPPPL